MQCRRRCAVHIRVVCVEMLYVQGRRGQANYSAKTRHSSLSSGNSGTGSTIAQLLSRATVLRSCETKRQTSKHGGVDATRVQCLRSVTRTYRRAPARHTAESGQPWCVWGCVHVRTCALLDQCNDGFMVTSLQLQCRRSSSNAITPVFCSGNGSSPILLSYQLTDRCCQLSFHSTWHR